MKLKQYTASALLVAMLVTNSGPWIPMALANPIVPDAGRLGPQMDEARNGTTIVNINTPNGRGLSHNQYDVFSIDNKGAILNNANRPVNTELAGFIMGNPNMVGSTASTILNEVTGTGQTNFNGALEVAGNSAHVIIANPNGIAVNNGTFINAQNATLTTGNPIINDGKITGYDVQKGSIAIEGQGLNASKTARTDLLAEAVQLNAKVWAKDTQVVTGQNQVSIDANGKVTNVVKIGNSNQVGLDVSALGGMYANSIYLVGTNDGFGVNNKGILSTQNKITVDSTGRVVNTGTIATQSADITAESLEQSNKAKVYASDAKLVVNTLDQKDGSTVLTTDRLDIAASTLTNTDHSVLKTEGTLHIGKSVDANSNVVGSIDSIDNKASLIEAGQDGSIRAKAVANRNAGITLQRVPVDETEHIKNEVAPAGSIERYQLSEERVYGHDDPIPQDKVVVHSSENLQLSVNGTHYDSWTQYEYDRHREQDVVATSDPGRIISGGSLHIEADSVINEASQISAAGEFTGVVGHYEQTNPKGYEYITDNGTATAYSRHKQKGWDSTNIDTAPYHKTTIVPKDVPVAVYGSHVMDSTTDIAVDVSVLHGMSQIATNPSTTYLIETDPNFTNRRTFLSSDYVLSHLNLDPMSIQKRLGDGYYEQQLVMRDIMRQTGKSRLQPGLTAEEQYKRLMDNGIKLSKSQYIALGRGLTADEQKALKEDVVLLVSKTLVLPDGNTHTVLVPTVYVAPTTKRVDGGANLQAETIHLHVDTMHNSGSMVADNTVAIAGNTLHNDNGLIAGNRIQMTANEDIRNTQGTIRGTKQVMVTANRDVINEGGTITQTSTDGHILVTAGRDVIHHGTSYEASDTTVTWDSRNHRHETVTDVDQGIINGNGHTHVAAGRDVSIAAGVVSSNGDASVTAGRNVNITSMVATQNLEEHRYSTGTSGGGHTQTTESHDKVNAESVVGSSIEGKNIQVVAGDAIRTEGSQILAAEEAKLSATNVDLNTATANTVVDHIYLDKKKGIVGREVTNATDYVTSKTVAGTVVSGKEIAISSANDVKGQSVALLGKTVTTIQAGGDVELGADKNITDTGSAYRHKKSGLLGGSGIGFTIGKEKLNIDESSHEEQTSRSTIASMDGQVNIVAAGKVHVTSADIVSKEKSTIDGTEVILDGNTDNTHNTYAESYKKSGLTVSLGGALVDNLTTATRTIKQAGGRDDKRLTAFELNEARKQLQDGYNALDKALKGANLRDAKGNIEKVNGYSKQGQKNIDDAINVSVSIGSTSRKQSQVVDINTYQGGTLVSEGTVDIISRDADSKGITLVGEQGQVKAITFDSASDLHFEAGKNTVDVTNTYKNSGWNVGASVSLASGSLLDINASAHMARQNGDTHQESYVPTAIKAIELAQLKAKHDFNVIGSTVSAKKINADIGNNLTIQSLQDVDNFKEHSKSGGFTISSKPNFTNPIGSVSAGVGRIDSKWRSVTKQAGLIAGEEGYDLAVGNTTTLEGAVIKSDAPKDINTFSTKGLEMKDIHNEAEYSYQNNGVGYNYYGSKQALQDMRINDKQSYDKIYNNIGFVPNLGVGARDKAESTTQSAISDGMITVDGKQIDTNIINTDTENTLNELNKIFDRKKIEERQELARLFAKNAYEQLHNWQPTTKEGRLAKSMAHGIVGEIAARLAGNTPGSGFKATMTNEMLIGQIKKLSKNDPAAAQWISGALGALVNKTTGESTTAGAAMASYATKWNENVQYTPDSYEGRGIELDFNIVEYAQANKEELQAKISRKITEKTISELAKSEIRNNIGSVKANINLYQGVRFIGRVSVVVTVADGVYQVGKLKYEYRPQTQEEYQEWLEFNDYDK